MRFLFLTTILLAVGACSKGPVTRDTLEGHYEGTYFGRSGPGPGSMPARLTFIKDSFNLQVSPVPDKWWISAGKYDLPKVGEIYFHDQITHFDTVAAVSGPFQYSFGGNELLLFYEGHTASQFIRK